MFPKHQIVGAEVCKGADRRRVPFTGITKQESPLRLSIGIHRNEIGHFCDDDWENWTQLSRKNLIRNCPPSRMLITVFARPLALEPSPSSVQENAITKKCQQVSQDRSKRSVDHDLLTEERHQKKVRVQHTDDSQRSLPKAKCQSQSMGLDSQACLRLLRGKSSRSTRT